MCNCFDEVLLKMKKKVFEKLDGTPFKDLEVKWKDYSFFLDGKPHVPVNPKIKIEYRRFKKNKEPMVNLTKDEVSIIARFCPFCGEDTKESEDVK